jgi:hypothetical protein
MIGISSRNVALKIKKLIWESVMKVRRKTFRIAILTCKEGENKWYALTFQSYAR